MIFVWVALGVLAIWYFYSGYGILRQKEIYLGTQNELYNAYYGGIGNVQPNNLCINAGEANIVFYEPFAKRLDEKLQQNSGFEVSVVFGPKLSTFASNKVFLDERKKDFFIPKNDITSDELFGLHPLFALKNKYPNRVRLYLKQSNNDSHFAIIDGDKNKRFLYIEKPHLPLNETEAMLFENPNPVLWKKYKKISEDMIKSNEELEIGAINTVPFAFFQEGGESNGRAV